MSEGGRVLVTGASGFIGRHLAEALSVQGASVIRTSRNSLPGFQGVGALGPETDWQGSLLHVGTVVHLAARVHITTESATDPLSEFMKSNALGSEHLVLQAAEAGVERVVFLSTVAVVGNSRAEVVDETTPTNPENDYARSKLEAEQRLMAVAADTDIDVVTLRVPLVYGPGAPGGMTHLRPLVEKGIPLPFGSLDNERSAIGVENLVSAIVVAMESSSVANQTLFVEDGTVWSALEMVRCIGQTVGRSARVVSVPNPALRLMIKLAGRQDLSDRLFGSLVVSGDMFRSATGWEPPMTVESSLAHGVL